MKRDQVYDEVFVSYSHADELTFAKPWSYEKGEIKTWLVAFRAYLKERLDKVSASVYWDETRLDGGDPIDLEIEPALKNARVFVALLSETLVNKERTGASHYCSKERELFRTWHAEVPGGARMIAVLLDPNCEEYWKSHFGNERLRRDFYRIDPRSEKSIRLGEFGTDDEEFFPAIARLAQDIAKQIQESKLADSEGNGQGKPETTQQPSIVNRSSETVIKTEAPRQIQESKQSDSKGNGQPRLVYRLSSMTVVVSLLFMSCLYFRDVGSISWLLLFVHFLSSGMQSFTMRMSSWSKLPAEMVVFFVSLTTFVSSGSVVWAASVWAPSTVSDYLHPPVFWWWVFAFIGIGGTYFLINVARLEGQRHLPSPFFEPLSRGHVVIVLWVIYARDRVVSNLEIWSVSVVLIALIVIGWAFRSGGGVSKERGWAETARGTCSVVASVFLASALQLWTAALMSGAFPVILYMMFSSFGSLLVAVIALSLKNENRAALGKAAAFGIPAGILNFVTLGSMLVFLVDGKASQVYSAGALSMAIPVLLTLFQPGHTKPNVWQWGAFGFAMAAFVFQSAVRQ